MENQMKTIMPSEYKEAAGMLFAITKCVPPEKLYGFLQFMRGVSCGLDMAAGKQAATERTSA